MEYSLNVCAFDTGGGVSVCARLSSAVSTIHHERKDCLLCSVIVAIADSFVGHSFTQQMSGGCRGLGIPLGAGDGKTLSLGSPRAPGASRIIEPWLLGCGRQEKSWAREPGSLQSLGWRGREWEPQQAGFPKAHPELQFFTISYVLASRRFSRSSGPMGWRGEQESLSPNPRSGWHLWTQLVQPPLNFVHC